jgi:phosphate uptake regulator
MRTMTCLAAALVLAFATACDRDRNETADRTDNAAEETSAAVQEGADDVGDAAEGVADAADDATDDVDDYSFERRDEFRTSVRERLDALDRELAESERNLNEDAGEARVEAVTAARDARRAVERSLERVGDATRNNWDTLREEIDDALDAAELKVRELRPDANPMGGAGGPS